jgi:hypothetical protein
MGDLDIDGAIIVKRALKNRMGGRWVNMIQDKWRALSDTAMNLRVPSNEGNFLNTQELLTVASNLLHEASDIFGKLRFRCAQKRASFRCLHPCNVHRLQPKWGTPNTRYH